MSKYTTEVRYICESESGLKKSAGGKEIDTILSKVANNIFGNFPIFDMNYRKVLEIKILKHYYFREIGFETVGMWKFKLNSKMNEIMPYYNKLYESALLEFNPFYDTDLTTTHYETDDKTHNGTNDKTHNGTNDITHDNNNEKKHKGTNELKIKKEINDHYKGNSTIEDNGTSTDKGTVKNTGTVQNDNSNTNTLDGTAVTTGTDWEYFNDTPQGGISNLNNLSYLTTAKKNTMDDKIKTDNITEDIGSSTRTDNLTATTDMTNTIKNINENTTEYNDKNITDQRDLNETEYTNKEILHYTDNTINHYTDNDITHYIDNVINHYETKVVGKQGGESYSKLLQEFRDTFLNIDMMIIDELSDLFMNIW